MVAVRAANREDDGTLAKTPGLALDSRDATGIFDQQVAASVLTEREVEPIAGFAKGKHYRKRRPVADVLRVLHVVMVAYTTDNIGTIGRVPE
jgi:hypothetical protein